ncbi:MAG TPA: TolC family protein [Kofleriaceae bacterium]|nr:TolC family protein [Kofleriaceae bacterium]
MNRFTFLVAAVLGALHAVPAAAQPRGRAQANAATAPAAGDDDADGPQARGVALFKLDDIIEVAVRLSPDIARARADRDVARGAAGAARRDQAWILSASANYQRTALGADTPDAQLQPLQQLADDKVTASLGLGRNLPTGGNISLELGLSHDRQELNITGEVLAQAEAQQSQCGENVDIFCLDQASARLTLKQPLGRSLGTEVALAPERKADLAAVETTVRSQLAAEELIRDVVSAYWELAYAAYEVDTRAEALELARKQEQLTRQEMRAGTASQNALDAVTYEIALRDEALLTSKLAFEKKSLDLRRKVGLEIGRRDIAVRPSEPLEIDAVDWNVDDVLARSHKANRQLATVLLEKKAADVDVAVAHDLTKPQVDLTLSGAVLGTGDTSSVAISALGGDVGYGYQVMAGLTMSFELSGAAKAGEAAAFAKRHRLEIDRVDLERQIDAEVTSAVEVLMSGRTRVALSDKAIAIAEENLKAERASFLAQRSTNFQVMQRQTQVIDAKLRRGRAVADYRVAVAQLQFLSGTLLDAYRIHVRGRAARDED